MLREQRHDQRLPRGIAPLRKAGDLEDWRFPAPRSGVPQGGVCRPVLRPSALDRLEQGVDTVLLPASHRGERRRPYRPAMAFRNAARTTRLAGERAAATRVRHQAQHLAARAPNAPHWRRVWYVRDADDWRLGCSGPREEAEAITGQRTAFRRDTRTRTLAEEKTRLPHARTASARVLGAAVVTPQAEDTPCRAHPRRCRTGALGVKMPVEVRRR